MNVAMRFAPQFRFVIQRIELDAAGGSRAIRADQTLHPGFHEVLIHRNAGIERIIPGNVMPIGIHTVPAGSLPGIHALLGAVDRSIEAAVCAVFGHITYHRNGDERSGSGRDVLVDPTSMRDEIAGIGVGVM